MIQGIKVVTAQEMARIEGIAYAKGASEIDYMENAAEAIADLVERFIDRQGLDQRVTLLVGKGNNGGDAYAAGRRLIEKGFSVVAYHVYSLESCSPLCQEMCESFKLRGGPIHFISGEDHFAFEPEGVILDGLFGTGFQGAVGEDFAKIIQAANGSQLPIIAIDIPSGVTGDTGAVETVAIEATMTIYLGLPKLGFFMGKGWDHVGELTYASFGLDQVYIDAAKASAYLVNLDSLSDLMPKTKRTRHKYEAGYVLGVAGSPGMSGAALLSSVAALKSGAGIVRLFHPLGMEGELSHAPYELIREGWNGKEDTRIVEEIRRAKALFLGPGIGRGKEAEQMVKRLLSRVTIPCVIDADALFCLAENPQEKLPERCILTPHRQEMKRLLAAAQLSQDEQAFHVSCQAYVEEKQVTLVLKGAPTWIFSPHTPPLIMTAGNPGMATAGSGDVLTGMIAAMLAQGLEPLKAALLATALHGLAGEHAASHLTSYCMTASDLLDYLPDAFLSLSDVS
jgi:ADP-dependent NAD(P)H-hydrate dehydratase / NAD(P)H-hydrate epimerase